jgi:cell shape-determining protein MreC
MKTTHRPKSRNKIWISSWIIVGILILAVIIKYGAPSIAMPFMKAGAFIHDLGTMAASAFTSKSSLETENQNLKDQLTQVQVEIDRDKVLTQENSDLKELLGRHTKSSSILATVLAKPPLSLYDTLIVDVGSSDKVAVGDAVFAFGLVPIGTVSNVSSHTSTVLLFSSAGQKVEVRIGKNVQTSAEAQGGGNFLIKLPKGTTVVQGDPVSAPGIGAEIFGHVENIETNDNDPFIYVRFSLLVNMNELHFLQIDRATTS